MNFVLISDKKILTLLIRARSLISSTLPKKEFCQIDVFQTPPSNDGNVYIEDLYKFCKENSSDFILRPLKKTGTRPVYSKKKQSDLSTNIIKFFFQIPFKHFPDCRFYVGIFINHLIKRLTNRHINIRLIGNNFNRFKRCHPLKQCGFIIAQMCQPVSRKRIAAEMFDKTAYLNRCPRH